jgi:Protein of unknown function (DUF1631)
MDTPFPTLSADFLNSPQAPVDAKQMPRAAAEVEQVEVPNRDAMNNAEASADVATLAPAESSSIQGLREALVAALDLAPQVIENLIGRALLGIDRQSTAQADASYRAFLDSSAAALEAYRRKWIKQFTTVLRIAIAHPPAAQSEMPIADVRICAAELSELDQLMQSSGSQRGNPLGPQTYVRALYEVIVRSQASAEQRQIWAQYLIGALGTQLAWVYPQISAILRNPGNRDSLSTDHDTEFSQYAQFVYGLGGEAPVDLPAIAQPESMMTPQMRALAQEARQTVKKLRAVLGLPEIDESLQSGDEMTQMMRDIDESERLMLEVNKRGLDPDAPVLDQTSLKIERLLNDYRNATTPSLARMPNPVRSCLERLQQPLEKLAALDKSLLTLPDHPVRQFLGAVSKRSLLFANETADGFDSFFGPVEKMIEAVSQVAPQSAKLYSEALARMQPVWALQDQELKKLAEEKERSLARLEVRKQLASRLAFELVSRRDASDAPVAVKQFLMGPWAQVLARAQLHPQHADDEQRYEYTVALLLWSVSARRAGSHKEDLIERVPSLVQSLRAGMASIQLPAPDVDAFLTELKKHHEAALSSDILDDSPDAYPPESPQLADLSGMMMLGSAGDEPRSPPVPPPAPPSYQSDLNLL